MINFSRAFESVSRNYLLIVVIIATLYLGILFLGLRQKSTAGCGLGRRPSCQCLKGDFCKIVLKNLAH